MNYFSLFHTNNEFTSNLFKFLSYAVIFELQDSRDNMSIVLVTFPGAPTPSTEAIQKEKQLEERLERRVRSELNNYCNVVGFVFELRSINFSKRTA